MSVETSLNQGKTIVPLPPLAIAPAQLLRGAGVISQLGQHLPRFGKRALVISGDRTWKAIEPALAEVSTTTDIKFSYALAIDQCSDRLLANSLKIVNQDQIEVIIAAGGGKVLDLAKLVAFRAGLPIVTIPTTAATCAAWTALSNIYTEAGAFDYDVALDRCPDLMVVDYEVIATAPQRTLVAGIGDAIAKWYEASVSSGSSDKTMIIAAVQQARVLRDILLQKSETAIAQPGGDAWREVVDASVCLAGVIGGVGGAQCRTVAAHAVHNGLTHLKQAKGTLHGEKVAYGILVQLRLEEFNGNQLAATARQQLLKFYAQIGLPQNLDDLGLGDVTLKELEQVAAIACLPNSDIHHLPFAIHEQQLVAAMVSTTVPVAVNQ
ncbi:Glycerol dehydrogenase [Thalassoporum mexicanum PCC 7367]|uniref:iron-containing alcohol dehydrogenase family protein n=1 Tax=Thalassoporum mexicanum TaxID=3457544 RepID=UPI00029F9CB6|nr:iron-containing alcohol dehydrogenase family protein [Pseudanabaena sp. PCC 7367]AFY70790.1 Glycerol dehydrogenase [Pseudanabaena sp. PCC 7367]